MRIKGSRAYTGGWENGFETVGNMSARKMRRPRARIIAELERELAPYAPAGARERRDYWRGVRAGADYVLAEERRLARRSPAEKRAATRAEKARHREWQQRQKKQRWVLPLLGVGLATGLGALIYRGTR